MTADPIQNALDQMAAIGLVVDEFITDGKLRRIKTDDDKGAKKSGWYVAHEFNLDSGRMVITGKFGNWKYSSVAESFQFDATFTDEEKQAFKKQQAANRKAAEQEKQARNKQAADNAQQIWPGLPTEGQSDYLARKKIHGFGCRYSRGRIAVPLYKNGNLTGIQWIDGDGGKKFLTGTEKQGAYFEINADGNGRIILCEGYATGCSIATALGREARVVVCFDAGNLEAVAAQWINDGFKITIAADNDHNKPANKGMQVAYKLQKKFNTPVVWPAFAADDSGTDFNDLHVSSGTNAIVAAFSHKEQQPWPDNISGSPGEPEISAADFTPPGIDDLQQPAPKNRADSPSLRGVDGFDFSLESMLENYAHIYGKSPQIFDKRARKLITPATLHEIAERNYKDWKKDPTRHIVDESGVVFDPSMQSCPDTTVNLFGGFPLQARQGECGHIINLLYYLVNENDQAFEWLLNWIALPLQRPGAKMRTAVVMHGPEGAGKNLFWSVIEKIYGEYSTIITQNEIESQFNGWASKKLFVIGNEVVSRQEMYHKKGIIKNMITEPEWLINDKNMPLRREANHANFVFFSNVMQPVTPDTGDRRFMVLWTPQKQKKDYYNVVVDEINNGGVEAFYHYLMQLDVGDYSEFSEPVMTQAKNDLIDLSMRSDERFIKRWKAHELPVPFCLCRTVDLYSAYQYWGRVEGEKFTVSKTEFLMRLNHDQDTDKLPGLRYLIGSSSKRTTFIGPRGQMAEVAQGTSKEKFAGGHAEAFIQGLSDWRGDNYAPQH